MLGWLNHPPRQPDGLIAGRAAERQAKLTKPPGSLGRLEQTAIRLASLQGVEDPAVERVHIAVFAADHGVAEEGVSAFPQVVTVQMVANFVGGGAAVSVLARELGAVLEIIDCGTASEQADLPGVVLAGAGKGTANLRWRDAMDSRALEIALQAGADAVERAHGKGAQLFIGGEMGIANTTSAAALGCALLQLEPGLLAGPGTGLGLEGVAHKARIIGEALARYQDLHHRPLEALRCLGGFEIAALAGAFLRAGQLGIPVLIDGFITTAAALAAVHHQPALAPWLLFSHRSAEPGHQIMLDALDAEPLLDLGMRLGEGSGAASTVPLLRMACALHNGMATFADAGVSGD